MKYSCLVLILLFLFIPRLSFSDEPVSKISTATQTKIDTEWKKIDQGNKDIIWQYRVSLPFPADWPSKGTDYYYIYANGQDIRHMIADGELIARPWAKIEVSPTDQKLIILSTKLKKIGIQGVRPLKGEDVRSYRARQKSVKQGDTTYETQKKYYCWWLGNNGVIADIIRPHHEAFFKWLECK